MRFSFVVAVAVGGAAGAVARHLLTIAFPDTGPAFPWTTFAINVAGSFVLALLPAVASIRRHPILPPLLGTGLLGGFTTLSTYSEQTRALLASGHATTAGLYVVGTLAACLVAVAAADRLSTATQRREFDAEEGDL
ncbi:MAG TPA: CrcB family protein [Nocardioides sp.]|uniref:FluC/FEX family fluoride channel n=1 Tax=Nocardioides sp. TaxID=35761 RepID=UPI002D7FBD3A|nr:CrcB family protein [Nocardioides sp.]HET6652928.1 CrcB family protein [Nocardioides sp.]